LEDTIHMIKTNIKSNHIQIENLYKSMFVDIDSTSIELNNKNVVIRSIDPTNSDAASLELTEEEEIYNINYWDGYSLAESEEHKDLQRALKIFKRMAKKMAKNLRRFSQ
jgi:hypothetical protein